MIRLEVLPDPDAAAARVAALVEESVNRVVTGGGRFAWAVSGGEGPDSMFRRVGALELPWSSIDTWQVDERIAPLGDPDRNRTRQERAFPSPALEGIRWMPVEDEDQDASAAGYAATLPGQFDLVHLGLGTDGHTASLVPGDPVLDVVDRDVAVTGPYEGRRRMTLTYPALARSRLVVWLVTGEEKRDAVRSLIADDRSIPAARVAVADQILITDRAASTA
jgi:6-phosphogluconolactonase